MNSQLCHGISQNDRCSTNSACGCLQMVGAANDTGICGFNSGPCSQLTACGISNNFCYELGSICVHLPRCFLHSVCLPKSMTDERVCPPMPSKRTRDVHDGVTATAVGVAFLQNHRGAVRQQ